MVVPPEVVRLEKQKHPSPGLVADSRRLIRPGITQAEVLKLCGPPTSKTEETVPVRSGDLGGGSRVVGDTTTSRWTYQSSSRTRVLLFDQDVLRSIE